MAGVVTYEERLNQDRRWALREGSRHFERESAVFKTMEAITKRLDQLGIAYAVVGGMAMFMHGYRRFTEDVDLLVTPEGLELVHEKLVDLGYLPPFAKSKNLRNTETGVRIEFLVTGGFPGDGLPKPVAFPDPSAVSVEFDGIRCLNLETLIQLKLASGTAPGRRKDLADVQELIRFMRLPEDFSLRLHESVRESFRTLWTELQQAPPEE